MLRPNVWLSLFNTDAFKGEFKKFLDSIQSAWQESISPLRQLETLVNINAGECVAASGIMSLYLDDILECIFMYND